ncbi:MAG: FHA domain-containing protein [Planctomycetes bacterium]|nr:FHA domain-containing protein [Planctomycetota bacterium]
MAIFSKMYFNAVFGALGGLLGWMLFGVLGEKNPSNVDLNLLLGGAIIGGSIGYFVVSVEAIRDQSLVRFARLASYGVLIAMIGGAFGMYAGDLINTGILKVVTAMGMTINTQGVFYLILGMIARGLGWSLLGIAIGASEGIAARSIGKFSYGTVGGLLGGFIGGVLFELFYYIARQTNTTTYFWSALGLVILGACIGSLSALVQTVFQPANVKVMRGWQEGREYALDKPANLLGRDEHADIALFRDMKVEKKHCYINQVNGKYFLVNNGAPAEFTLVNETPVADQRELVDGDRIQLGNVILKFQLRAALNRAKKTLPLPTASAS